MSELMIDKENRDNSECLSRFMILQPFICAMMVIGIHSYGAGDLEQISAAARIESFFSHGLFMAAVPIFFFVSGFLFFKNVENIQSVFRKMGRRIRSVIVPFLSWSMFYYVFYAVASRTFSGISTTGDISVVGIIKGVLLYEYVFPMWFMFQLVAFVTLAPFVFVVLKKQWTSILVFLTVTVLGLCDIDFSYSFGNLDRILFAPNYFTYYFCGCWAASRKMKLVTDLSKKSVCILSLILLATSVGESLIYDFDVVVNKRLFVPIISASFLVLLCWLAGKKQVKLPMALMRIPTMVVYGVHPFIGIVCGRGLQRLNMPAILHYCVAFALCAFLSCVVAVQVKKVKILNYLFNGNR